MFWLFLAVTPISRTFIIDIQAYFYTLHGFTNEGSFTVKLILLQILSRFLCHL
jgi:hypothetical protein